MNIRDELSKKPTKIQAQLIAEFACSSKENFSELMKCFLDNEYRVAQSAASSVSWVARQKPGMIQPHLKEIVKQLSRKDTHNAVVRNSLRIIENFELPLRYHAEIMNSCFSFIATPSTPVAIKAFSLTILYNFTKLYPDLKFELKSIIEDRWDSETAAFKSRGRKILAAIK